MALAPISRGNPAAPARPLQAAERLPVPGRPAAEAHRPAASPGRIPVAADEPTADDNRDLAVRIDREVRQSREYQILRPFLPDKARADDEDADATRPPDDAADTEARPTPTAAVAQVPAPPAGPPSNPPSTAAAESQPRRSDPLALDLDGNGLQTTGVENGGRFDIDADGRQDQVSFVSGADAFLALDRNGNGRIDDGSELFGDQNGHANGYQALADYDSNADGRIDRSDPVYERLRLLRMSADGQQQLTGLGAAGIAAIDLGYRDVDTALNRYDSIAQTGSFTREDGSTGLTGDLLLGYRELA